MFCGMIKQKCSQRFDAVERNQRVRHFMYRKALKLYYISFPFHRQREAYSRDLFSDTELRIRCLDDVVKTGKGLSPSFFNILRRTVRMIEGEKEL